MVVKNIQGSTFEMNIGSQFHDDAFELYDKIDKGAILRGEVSISEEYAKHLPDNDPCKNFIQLEQKRFDNMKRRGDNLEEFFPLYRELYLKDDEIKFYGTVDRVDKVGDDYAVLDYKVSKYPKHQSSFSKHRLELAGYAHLVNASGLVPGKVKFIGIIFVGEVPGVFYEKLKDISKKAFYRNLNKVREAVQSHMFEKKPGYVCQWCPYDEICLTEEATDVE